MFHRESCDAWKGITYIYYDTELLAFVNCFFPVRHIFVQNIKGFPGYSTIYTTPVGGKMSKKTCGAKLLRRNA